MIIAGLIIWPAKFLWGHASAAPFTLVYLDHGVVLETITSLHIVNPQFDAVMIFSLIVGISLLTYQYIELPFIRLSKQIAQFDRSKVSAALNVEPIA